MADMQWEKKDDKIQITISANLKEQDLERLKEYVKYLEISSQSKADPAELEPLAEEIKQEWWEKNKEWLLN
jgi:hypothetical protein